MPSERRFVRHASAAPTCAMTISASVIMVASSNRPSSDEMRRAGMCVGLRIHDVLRNVSPSPTWRQLGQAD